MSDKSEGIVCKTCGEYMGDVFDEPPGRPVNCDECKRDIAKMANKPVYKRGVSGRDLNLDPFWKKNTGY